MDLHIERDVYSKGPRMGPPAAARADGPQGPRATNGLPPPEGAMVPHRCCGITNATHIYIYIYIYMLIYISLDIKSVTIPSIDTTT